MYFKFNILDSRQGFTLIELLLYVSIVGMMILSVSALLPLLMQSRVKNQTISEVAQQGTQAMQIITQTIRNSTVINSPTIGASASSLSVDTITAGNNPTVFDLSSGVLRIKEGTDSAVSLTNSRVVVSSLTFQNLSRTGTNGTIRIQYVLTHVNPSGRQEYDFNKTFYGSATIR
jgi:type II secretory pathway pseudopilin PulG